MQVNLRKDWENMNEDLYEKSDGLTLDDIYFKDAFTKTEDKLDLEVNNITADCITSKNNTFSVDEKGNIVANSIIANNINFPNAPTFDQIYPVGSIYMSINENNPGTLFGGKWEQITDVLLLSAGDKHTLEEKGGEETHLLVNEEMPKHKHKFVHNWGDTLYAIPTNIKLEGMNVQNSAYPYTSDNPITISEEGGNQPHNNMPPYLTVFMWKRIS